MAVDLPDPKSFQTWEDAFQYPIPAVRRMEQQLRGDITTNKDRLRTLVGTSYRDLLGTAERIIGMDKDMTTVEGQFSTISEKCNSRAVGRLQDNFQKLEANLRSKDRERYMFASQLAILQSCPLVISRLLRNGGSLLLAAKVLVLSRHLHSALSHTSEAPPIVDGLRSRLASLRGKLLRHVDRQFAQVNAEENHLLDSMCAFALATSSAQTDIFRHFHHVRSQAVVNHLGANGERRENALKSLKLYLRTLKDSQQMFPAKLGSALLKLRSQPLRRDPSLRSLEDLNIDTHEPWMSDEVRNFTPWIRHDDLQRLDVQNYSKEWAVKTFCQWAEHLTASLADVVEFPVLVHLRTDLFKTWFEGQRELSALISEDFVGEMRSVLKHHLIRIIRERSSQLENVGVVIRELLATASVESAKEDLWDHSFLLADLSNGASTFKSMVKDRSQGRSAAVRTVASVYTEWRGRVEAGSGIIDELKSQRWDDDLDDDDNELDLDLRNRELSVEDPQSLESDLSKVVTQAFQSLEESLKETIRIEDTQATRAIFLLRVLREIRQKLPETGNTAGFALSLIPQLQSMVGQAVMGRIQVTFQRQARNNLNRKKVVSRSLWEGTPPLPVLPSPYIFKFMHDLVREMAELGNDVWSPSCVSLLKEHLWPLVDETFNEVASKIISLESSVTSPSDNEKEAEPDDENATPQFQTEEDVPSTPKGDSPELKHDLALQLCFDLAYLRRVLSLDGHQTALQQQQAVEKSLFGDISEFELVQKKLQKNVQDYLSRTKLLFAALL